MSDMSLPPLSLVPQDQEDMRLAALAQADAADNTPALPWPSCGLVGYPAESTLQGPIACEFEGPGGRASPGWLTRLDLEAGVVHLQIPPARSVLTLKLTQFRRLTLLPALEPLPTDSGSAFEITTPMLPRRDLSVCTLRFRNGNTASFETAAHTEVPTGLFTWSPIDAEGGLRRSFFPLSGTVDRALEAKPEAGPEADAELDFNTATEPMALDDLVYDPSPAATPPTGKTPPPTPVAPELLLPPQISSLEQLVQAIDLQTRMPMVRIGEALIALGFITQAQLAQALQWQSRDSSLPLGELLVDRGIITRANLQLALARKMGYPLVEVDAFPAEPTAALRLPMATARRLPALPLAMHRGRLVVALEDPSSRDAIDQLEFTAQCKVYPVLAPTGSLHKAIERLYQLVGSDNASTMPAPLDYDAGDSARNLLAEMEQSQGGDESRDETPIEQSDNQLVRLINNMILDARQQRVSDIHIECQGGRDKVQIRFRRDGVLRPYLQLPHTYRQALVARIKVMCDLDISERRKPQDGKIAFNKFVQGQKLELRVATIPTANGLEDVVMRLLASAKTLPLESMGMQPDTLSKLKSVIERPYGMVLCVGPTGSGKTTTLHAALGHINTPERKIWTAEDPVEITQPGLRQVQVNPKIDWTFAKALRAFLRADPDVVMVGEIRDGETAHMAVEASLTGHLVLSTLHTNSAPETVTRLLDMGMDPFSFADSLLAVLAQRLVRRLCKHCVSSRPATVEDMQALVDEYQFAFPDPAQRPSRESLLAEWSQRYAVDGTLLHHHAPGCPHCDQSGFSGRVGLHELLVVSRELRHLIQTSARAEELQRVAMNEGMRTLRQDGIHKVLAGLTTIAEVRATSNG